MRTIPLLEEILVAPAGLAGRLNIVGVEKRRRDVAFALRRPFAASGTMTLHCCGVQLWVMLVMLALAQMT